MISSVQLSIVSETPNSDSRFSALFKGGGPAGWLVVGSYPFFNNKKKGLLSQSLPFQLERAMGIEPTSKAWEAFILPMNYARIR